MAVVITSLSLGVYGEVLAYAKLFCVLGVYGKVLAYAKLFCFLTLCGVAFITLFSKLLVEEFFSTS